MRIILVFFLFDCFQLSAQFQDSTVRKYFVCESTSYRSSLIIKDGNRILVRDTSGNKLRGVLNILDDTLIEVRNLTTGITDTFNIRAIDKVRRPSMYGNIVGGLSTGISLAMMAFGAVLTFDTDESIKTLGVILTVFGGIYTIGSLNSINGKTYRPHQFKYSIVKTKGYKLRNKFLWYIGY